FLIGHAALTTLYRFGPFNPVRGYKTIFFALPTQFILTVTYCLLIGKPAPHNKRHNTEGKPLHRIRQMWPVITLWLGHLLGGLGRCWRFRGHQAICVFCDRIVKFFANTWQVNGSYLSIWCTAIKRVFSWYYADSNLCFTLRWRWNAIGG